MKRQQNLMLIDINSGGVKRVPLYDNLKAIGIILVVLGHVTENQTLSRVIYSFHMSLFFFISGMLYKPREWYAAKLARSILWPYFVFAILSFAYWAFFETKVRPIPEETNVLEQFTNIFYPMNMERHAYLMNVVLWFLPALYLCSIAYHYLLCRIENVKMQLVVVGVIAIILQFINVWLPLCVPQALSALPFFTLGHLLNGKIKNYENISNRKKCIILIAIMVFILLCLCSPGGDIRLMSYPLGYVPYCLIAMCCIIAVFMLVPRRHIGVLNFLGYNSLGIMLVHEPLKRVVIKLYSMIITVDMEIVRISVFHSLVITSIVFIFLCPIVLLLRKYGSFLLRV